MPWSRKESRVTGFFVFLHILTIGYFRLGLMNAPQGLEKREKLL